ncbi:phage/plasmid primase, P4 family [Stomatobaculum longum]|uniref:DNA primase family protein n=1 Tax=Stomatobaculum longum TaxID=796942 RepID=UPI002803F15E|nr:phage/plasmid primase, P4 family [Stomatobaculum longum]
MAGAREHNPEDLITKITACAPLEVGKTIWVDALNTFFVGDQELIEYVQQTVGVAAVGKVFQEHMIIAYGGGANGKSTFWNTIFRVLGNYAGKISAEALTMNCKRNVKPEMAELKGKRLIIASEMEEGMRLNTATVKQLCSTDEIQAEKKYKDPFSFVPSHTLVLYTNHLPKVVEDAIESYREDNDWLGQFIEECCDVDKTYTAKSGELYQVYRAHCTLNGEYIRSTSDFYSSMEKAGFNKRKTNKGILVMGIGLKDGQDFPG